MTQTISDMNTFSSSVVADLAGLSPRQLQRWSACVLTSLQHNGRIKCYSDGDLLLILVLAELRRKKLSFQKVRSLIPQVTDLLRGLACAPRANRPDYFLLSDGRRAWLVDSSDKTCKVVANVLAPLACVDVRQCLEVIDQERDKPVSKKLARGVETLEN